MSEHDPRSARETPGLRTTSASASERIVSRVRALRDEGRSVLVATDFDGTLSPIVTEPASALPEPRALEALAVLGRAGIPTCIATGRALDDLRERLGVVPPGCALIAEHGATVLLPSAEAPTHAPIEPGHARALAAMATAAEAMVQRFPGAAFERKPTSFAVHVRAVSAELRDAVECELATLSQRARTLGLGTIAGRAVLELRAPLPDKGEALRTVARALCGEGAALVYAGDDTTDEPALEAAAASGGLAVYVLSSERPAPRSAIEDVELVTWSEWAESLVRLAATIAPT